MTDEQFKALIARNRESESLEAKPGGSRHDVILAARVVRAALGMANHENGGWIVVGIEEHADGTFDPVGVPDMHLSTWNHDDVSAMINGVAEPHVVIDADLVTFDSRSFVVIRVHEFVDVPVICRSQGPSPPGERQLYRKDACYARSRRKPETIEATSDATTWRTLIELASTKGASRILRVIGAGPLQPQGPSDEQQFAAQLEDLR